MQDQNVSIIFLDIRKNPNILQEDVFYLIFPCFPRYV